MHPKRCLFDHVFPDPPPRAFDPIWPMPLDPNRLTFQDDSLNRAVSCVRKYLEHVHDDTEWFHASVRSVAFPSFLEAMDADEGRSRTLPFSCWCDGGAPEEPSHRQHRHMLVVSSPRGHFIPNVWKKIAAPRDRLPRSNFRCVLLKPIQDTMHLVNTLGYVCTRQSQCLFAQNSKKAPVRDNHFYLFESLPADYRLCLVLQWEGGLLQLFNQAFKNMRKLELVQALLDRVGHQYKFRIQNIPGITLNTVLPVSRDLQPASSAADDATRPYLHLIGSDKLYFERDPSLADLHDHAWLQRQAERGNLFHHVVGEKHWTPLPHHQALLNDFKPIVDRNRELEVENARVRLQLEHLEREHARCPKQREQLEKEVAFWKQEASQWRKKCRRSEQQVKRLWEKVDKLKDREIQRLRRENRELRRENEEQRREIQQLKREE